MKKGQKHKTLRTHFTEHRNIDGGANGLDKAMAYPIIIIIYFL
jgi:hypothetical protein